MVPTTWLPQTVADLLDQLRQATPVWLVGGAVRDAFLERQTLDLDFVVDGDALGLARRTANGLGGFYYPLDLIRGTGRVILPEAGGWHRTLDFSRLRGSDITTDLMARDFSVNAMAVALDAPDILIDPTGGLRDLKDKSLRACSPQAVSDDPVRALRAVRLAAELDLRIEPGTRHQVAGAAGLLESLSPERVRDEILRLLDHPRPARPLRALDALGLLERVFPEVSGLKGLEQPVPHALDAWDHTLAVVDRLGDLLLVLGHEHDSEAAADLILGEAAFRLGRFRRALSARLDASLSQGRRVRQLLFFSALYHDAGKAATVAREAGRIRFIGHEAISADLAQSRAMALRLSRDEMDCIRRTVLHHLRPAQLEQSAPVSPRAIYRFFRDTGDAGVDVVLLSLADFLGTHAPPAPQLAWKARLEIARTLLESRLEGPRERLAPTPVIRGDRLAEALGVKTGPEIGWLLEMIREAQAAGEVHTAEDALALAKRLRAGKEDATGSGERDASLEG